MPRGLLDSTGNPYIDRFGLGEFEPPRVVQPTLTLQDLDELVAGRLRLERSIFEAEKRHAQAKAWDEGRTAGRTEGREELLTDVGRELSLVVRHLEQRAEHPRSTIAYERTFIAAEAVALRKLVARWEAPRA